MKRFASIVLGHGLAIAALVAALGHSALAGQAGVAVSGQVYHAMTAELLPDVTVRLEELNREETTGPDGTFAFDGVPPGDYHLVVRAEGFLTRRIEIAVGAAPHVEDVTLVPELHYTEVVSVSPQPRGQLEAYQPTSVLAGQDLSRQLAATLGETLDAVPGVAERSFGPGPSRPVIRGFDGDRVLILEDGQRVGDLSSQSGDHGVMVNPAAATRIEVVRGPATLLYGSSAIGGLVNVISDTIPVEPVQELGGGVTVDFATAATDGGVATDLLWGNGRWAVHAGGGGRGSSDATTPLGEVENTQSRAGFGSVGASWTGERGYLGASYGYDDRKYGVPVIEEGRIQLTPRRHTFGVRGGGRNLAGFFESFRVTLTHRQYQHDELEGDEVGTHFENDTTDVELFAHHRRFDRLSGTVGAWGLTRAFSAVGEEALAPPVDENAIAVFLYEELSWPHWDVQFGGRLNHARFRPEGGLPERDFTDFSGSLGLLFRPPTANDNLTVALSLARAVRNPSLDELYYFGPHPGNFAFEIGNPDLPSERGIGFDASLRWRYRRVSGEVTYFRNDIRDYIFRNPITEEEFDERFGHEEEDEEGGHDHGEFPFIEFVSADSVLQGIEAHADFELTSRWFAETGLDYVRGTLEESGQPLPRIPPLRFRGGLRYQRDALQAGGEVVVAGDQDRTFGAETPTDGYRLLKLFSSYSFTSGAADALLHTLTVRLENATDELYRNHLSLIKEFVPEMGRNLRFVYSMKF